MAIYQKRINPNNPEPINIINGAKKIGIIIPQRVYMKYVLLKKQEQEEQEVTGFEITLTTKNNVLNNFLIGKTFIYETDQSSQNLITSLSFPQVSGIDWNDKDYINNDLHQIIVDYVI